MTNNPSPKEGTSPMFELNQEELRKAVTEQVERSLTDHMTSFATREAIRGAVATLVEQSDWDKIIVKAIGDINIEPMVTHVAAQSAKLMQSAVLSMLAGSMAKAMASIEHGYRYTTEEDRKNTELRYRERYQGLLEQAGPDTAKEEGA